MAAEPGLRRGFDRIYADGDRVDRILEALLPPSQRDPQVLALRSTAFLTTAVLARLEAAAARVGSACPAPARVLDLGCGRGRLGAHLGRCARGTLVGIDHSRHALAAAARVGDAGTTFALADLAALPLSSDSFELVLAVDVLHLVAELTTVLAEIRRVMRPGAALIATVYERAGSFGAIRGAERWRAAIGDAGLALTSFADVTEEWREEMSARHERRWQERARLAEQLGADAGPYLDVTRQMLPSADGAGFIAMNRRWELEAQRPLTTIGYSIVTTASAWG